MSCSINHGCPISSIIMLGVMNTYCNNRVLEKYFGNEPP